MKTMINNSKSLPLVTHLELYIFNLLKQGLNPAKISKKLKMPWTNLSYYLRKMKKEGLISKKGYGTWETNNSKSLPLRIPPQTTLNSPKEIRGHAFIWIVKVPKEIGVSIKEKASKIGSIMNKGQIRLIIKDHKVWIGKKNIVIYENKSFYGRNSIEARKYAAISLIEVLQALESQLGVNLRPYVFKPTKEHYGMIKNDLARQCNRNKEKIMIRDNLEGEWLWIDDSESLEELEVGGLKAITRSKQVQAWWNDQKKHNFEVSSSFILNGFNNLTSNLNYHAENLRSHVEAVKKLGNAVEDLTKAVKELKK